jgi:PAS domain S-box-containing protein
MQAHGDPDTSLGTSDLGRLFPFHISIDPSLRITHSGHALAKIAPGLGIHQALSTHFEILTPVTPSVWHDFYKHADDLWILQVKANGLKLRGEILCREHVIHFLISPWLNDVQELAQYDLSLSDFSIHDPIRDLLLLKQAEKIALEDTRRINHELVLERESLKRLNQALEIKEAHSRELAEIISKSNSGICIIQPGGMINWANTAFEQQSGLPLAQLVGKGLFGLPLFENEPVGKLQSIYRQMELCAAFDEEIFEDSLGQRQRSEWYEINFQPLLDTSGQLSSYLAFFRNVTEKKHAAIQLKRLTADLSNIFELCPDGFIAFDAYGQQSYANPALYRLTGLEPAQISKISIDSFNAIISELSLQAPNQVNDTATLVFGQPKTIIIKRTTRQSLDAQGTKLSTIQYFRDITHEYEMEQMKSDFLSMAAHELRTPMSSIHGFTELLLKREFPPSQQKEMIATIYRQTNRLIDMLNDLLDLARIETKGANALVRAEHDLVDIIREVSSEFSMQMQLVTQLLEHPVQVFVDRSKILRVLANLLSNAQKYSPQGSIVRIELSTMDDGMVSVRIEDQGIGMTPAQMEKLFTKFFRADNSGHTPGTGLGLCLVKEIIELHGGKVQVRSEFGKGTSVNLLLPIASLEHSLSSQAADLTQLH